MSEEPPKQPPIVPLEYITGVKVVDIGDLRIARGMTRRPHSSCSHKHMVYDSQERRIWCQDCEQNIDAFDAVLLLVEYHHQAAIRIAKRERELAEAEAHEIRSLAARQLDLAWQKRRMVPACPNCGCGLFPEDFKDGVLTSLGREYAEAQRRRRAKPP